VKILVVRFSSIGDIVLTTPVLRALKKQLEDCEIHFLTKSSFRSVIQHNEFIDKVITIDESIKEVTKTLKDEKYDWVIDLHNNIRTKSLKFRLGRPSKKFPKLHWKKWKLVKFKKDEMPNIHVVERYFQAVEHLGVKPDNQPCDFPIPESESINLKEYTLEGKRFCAVVVGAKFKTKQLPVQKLIEIINGIDLPVILIGGPDDKVLADELMIGLSRPDVYNSCGKHSILGSASILKQSAQVLTNDTGMMHIASCYDVPIISVWGNTVPSLGMYPYRPEDKSSFSIHEVEGLNCRPCSKIGYASCPKGHFDCMLKQNTEGIVKDVNSRLN
jgi:ADP-heptose:LPS heptosyltransferase